MTFKQTQYKPKFTAIKTSFILIFFIIALQATSIMAETVQLPADNFNDNSIGDIWVLNGDDLANVWLQETNQRLEGRSTKQTSQAHFATYFSRQWQLSTGHDFSVQVAWHFSSLAQNAGVGLVVHTDLILTSGSHVGVEAGRDDGNSTLSVDPWKNGIEDEFNYDEIPRAVNNGVFYVSYDSINDRLYLSINGYRRSKNPENGDWVFESLLKGSWDVDAVNVGVVFWNDDKTVATASGDAYFDNFQVTQGTATVDNDKDGYTVDQGDCNDNDAAIHPGATEICGDEIDQDCNGSDLSCSSDDDDDGGGCFISAIQ